MCTVRHTLLQLSRVTCRRSSWEHQGKGQASRVGCKRLNNWKLPHATPSDSEAFHRQWNIDPANVPAINFTQGHPGNRHIWAKGKAAGGMRKSDSHEGVGHKCVSATHASFVGDSQFPV